MNILVINSGSSSLKLQLIKTGKDFTQLGKFHADGIGLKACKVTFKSAKKDLGLKMNIKNHKEALNFALKNLIESKTIASYKEIDAIGHRVVHGGEKYSSATKIDAKVVKEISSLSKLAPLHNPANLEGILACKEILKRKPQVTVFDTAFHQTIPEKAYLYGLPYEFYKKHNIRKYGFHGTSHKYVTNETINRLKRKSPRIVTCHIGNGSSITASLNGKSIDTSMGFTPLEGIIMGTRSGSFDPAIFFHLQDNLKISPKKIYEIINNESGLKGLSEISSDMRTIYHESLKKNARAKLIIEILSYQIAKYIGSYAASLNGLDAITFTAGLGEKAFYIRQTACDYLEHLGVILDKKKNEKCEELISTPKSKIKVFVIPTNEGKQIAIETQKILKK